MYDAEMKRVTIYTDGACEGNPGPGGWAAVLMHKDARKEITGVCPATTNNRMELTAAIEALRAVREPCEIDLYTDSRYLQQGITVWCQAWKRTAWKRKKKPLKNVDLWKDLDAETQRHEVNWHWVRGHAADVQNERCDKLAVQAIAELRRKHSPAELAQALREFQESQRTDEGGSLF